MQLKNTDKAFDLINQLEHAKDQENKLARIKHRHNEMEQEISVVISLQGGPSERITDETGSWPLHILNLAQKLIADRIDGIEQELKHL